MKVNDRRPNGILVTRRTAGIEHHFAAHAVHQESLTVPPVPPPLRLREQRVHLLHRCECRRLRFADRQSTDRVAAKIGAGLDQIKEISMAKNFACSTSDKVTYDAVQIFGGYGFMRGYPVERLYRDNRVLSIGGGTTEIMKEIISKFLFK